jgi:hypothetical protein
LLEFAEKRGPLDENARVQKAYRTMVRFSGVQSHNAIRKALVELSEMGFLVLPTGPTPRYPNRQPATYIVTPNSEQLRELAHTVARQTQEEMAAEVELRKRQRNERLRSSRAK